MVKINIEIKKAGQFRSPVHTMQERYRIQVHQELVEEKDGRFHTIRFIGEFHSFIEYQEFTQELERHINY